MGIQTARIRLENLDKIMETKQMKIMPSVTEAGRLETKDRRFWKQ